MSVSKRENIIQLIADSYTEGELFSGIEWLAEKSLTSRGVGNKLVRTPAEFFAHVPSSKTCTNNCKSLAPVYGSV